MRLQQITASPHPNGNRIDLAWSHPNPEQYPGVRVVRRESAHPTTPTPNAPREGVVVADTHPTEPEHGAVAIGENGRYTATDCDLKGETVYYYALFPYAGDPPVYEIDRHNRTAAMATAPYDMAGQMAELLPALYHRYDTVRRGSNDLAAADRDKGQLRRFLDIPGSQLDQIYSFARAMLDLHHVDKVDARLLPLLAQWIGWPTDFRQEVTTQRNDIRRAPYLYQTIGLIPTVEAVVKRFIRWESRTKEFVHNVLLANRPERLNLRALQRDNTGMWREPDESLFGDAAYGFDFAYDGRPVAVRDSSGTLWLFYHTLKKAQWDIWYKTYEDGQGWTPSQPLTNRKRMDKHPTVAVQGDVLWVFWEAYDEANRHWRIDCRTYRNGQWSPLPDAESELPWADTDPAPQRRQPWAVADDASGVWLFWLEKDGAHWTLQHSRHDGSTWASPASFPLDNGTRPRVENDLFVLFHPTDTTQRLWVFWSRKAPAGAAGQTRWQIVYRVKASLDPGADDWSAIRELPRPEPDAHDREPAARVDPEGNVELFWSANREESWSIWSATVNRESHEWGPATAITSNPHSQRGPFPVSAATGALLIYRSNESVVYTSAVYGATETLDTRYAGCTTVDTRNVAKIALRGQFADVQTYTYDAGQDGRRTNLDWYARDTVGVYLTPDTEEPTFVQRNQRLLEDVLRQFLPIQVRVVFIIEPQRANP